MSTGPKQVDGLEINQVEDGYVIYQHENERVHYLNHTAVIVMEACDGTRTPEEIDQVVRAVYDLAPDAETGVAEVLEQLTEEGLLQGP